MSMERWKPSSGMIPWRPFRELEALERRFDDIFGRQQWPSSWRRTPMLEQGWMPAIEVFDKDDKFIVKAEVPGIKSEDIDISVVGDTLTIKGEKKADTEIKEEDYYSCERSYGSFYRSITLPSTVDANKIEANYEDGVLEIDIAKAPEVKPKKVTVSAKKKERASK
ncbi:MAG: Hsp20/alpha crystallin family protein [Dehalococcoidales bacterium]|nr:Hsp20/alpha crystallin family protein [Dehalococcoidales bacterium]